MTDAEFINLECVTKTALAKFFDACKEIGVDPEDRLADIVFDLLSE